jgi:hypothetical protein
VRKTLDTTHPDQLADATLAHVARVGAVKVVGDPAPDPVELDPEDDLVTVAAAFEA